MDEESTEVLISRLESAGFQESFPQTDEEADVVDDLLAHELEELSVTEQEKVAFDLHGLAAEIEETEELIETSLKEMENEIQKIKKKPAFEKAMKMNPGHVCNRQFRLQFLRCEFFICKNAAARLVFHFEKKEMIFGDGDVLGRDVRLSDLSQQDLMSMQSGALQILPTRDITGRSVLVWMPGNWRGRGKLNTRSAQRVFYYMTTTASQEEETQKKGFIIVVYNVGPKGDEIPTLGLLKKIHSIRLAVPHKMFGMHFCFDDKSLRPVVSGFRYFLDKRARNRFRAHFGDEQKTTFQLQTFGIPFDDSSPFKLHEGEFNLSWHNEWLQIRKSQEDLPLKKSDENDPVTIPHRFDVLFGRSKMTREHTGNLRALHLINMWEAKYEGAGKYEKTIITEKIVNIIRDSGGKFLKWENDKGWLQVDNEAAREKIAHWFRHNRKKHAASKNDKSAESNTQKRPFNQC
ncbi:unnamed protein product [Cylindrotheca closterium]|uniref:DUF6824 domain-containing protein n=1 Tax=Cylindrotheca closterium TaxID=2856 RepID=A0AAD2FIK7_9STRA|nr:unnamed protein product [Cylindrotheca closterium]